MFFLACQNHPEMLKHSLLFFYFFHFGTSSEKNSISSKKFPRGNFSHLIPFLILKASLTAANTCIDALDWLVVISSSPSIWYFAILHWGVPLKAMMLSIFFIQQNDIRLMDLVWGKEKVSVSTLVSYATMQWQFTFNSWTLSLSESSRHPFQNILTELTRAECIWYGCQLTEFAARRSC